MKPRYLLILSISLLLSCSKKQIPVALKTHFDKNNIPPMPDYAKAESWAALPDKKDAADEIPRKAIVTENQATAKADVFFLYPTIFTAEPTNQYIWNADVNDIDMNKNVDGSTILNQATIFNGSCRVFAPRYRQAHYYSFVTQNQEDKIAALSLAYADIKAAFLYYMENYNNGRPIIIASHSQGTVHAKLLLKEFFDDKPLQEQLVEAYLIGIATPANFFKSIKPSESAEDVGGFVSWNTIARDFYPTYYENGLSKAVSTNPLTWKLDETFAPKQLNKGGVGLKFTFAPQAADAQNHGGMLWINKPYITGRALINTKIWHKADMNLFWMNIRENVALRIEKYLSMRP
jgi:hypothetical protein